MIIEEIKFNSVNCIQMAQNRDQLQALVNKVMNIRVA
jgi:hypothetical protein